MFGILKKITAEKGSKLKDLEQKAINEIIQKKRKLLINIII